MVVSGWIFFKTYFEGRVVRIFSWLGYVRYEKTKGIEGLFTVFQSRTWEKKFPVTEKGKTEGKCRLAMAEN